MASVCSTCSNTWELPRALLGAPGQPHPLGRWPPWLCLPRLLGHMLGCLRAAVRGLWSVLLRSLLCGQLGLRSSLSHGRLTAFLDPAVLLLAPAARALRPGPCQALLSGSEQL